MGNSEYLIFPSTRASASFSIELYDVADFKNAVTEWWNKEGWTFQVWAKDKNHAIKIAKDWRRKLFLKGKK